MYVTHLKLQEKDKIWRIMGYIRENLVRLKHHNNRHKNIKIG